MSALPIPAAGERPEPRDDRAVRDIEFVLASYRRRYVKITEAPELIQAHWRRSEAELVRQLRLPPATEPHPDRPAAAATITPGVPHHGSHSIYDIRDVPAFCRSILDHELKRRGQSFQSGDYSYDDALGDLVCEVYRLAWRYDPARTPSFRLYVTFKLSNHAFPDIGRKLLKRNGAAIAERAHVEVDERADSGRRPWEAAAEDTADLLGRGSRDRAGVEADRVGTAAWRGSVLSLRVHRRAADGARPRQRGLPDSF